MVTTTARQESEVSTGRATPARRRLSRSAVALSVAAAFVAGAAVYAAVDDDPTSSVQPAVGVASVLDPGEIAEIRAQHMATLLEQQWLSDPMNVARLRAQEQARILEQQWLAGNS